MPISDQVQQIRKFINRPRRPPALLTSPPDWNTLCSALDVIRDTEMALDAYLGWEGVTDVGGRYLLLYGVLQVLLTQQDAVKKVCNTFQYPLSFPPNIEKIRQIRSDSIGHPTSGTKNKLHKANFIQRISLSHSGFKLMTVFSDSRYYPQQ